jgi:CHAT domain-containing protein
LSIHQKRYGEVHPAIADNLANQAKLFAKEGNFSEATSLLKKSLDIDERLIQQVMGFTSEKQKMIYLTGRSNSSDLFLSIAQRQLMNQEPFAREDALTLCLKRKGTVLETQRLFQEKLIQMDDPKAKATYQELSKIRTDLSALVFGRAGWKSPEDYHQRYNELEAKRIDLEERLIRFNQKFAAYKRSTHVDAATVAGILSNEMALVEIVKVRIYDFEGMRSSSDHYLAFILSAGKATNIGMADLGRAEEIEQLVSQYKTELFNPLTTSNISSALYLKIFNPLRSQMGEAKEIFISPDGELNLIPFEILKDENGRYLIEDYTFNYLATGRDIISFKGAREATGKAILIGDPDLEMAAQTAEEEKTDGVRLAALDERIQEPKDIVELRGLNFQQLPGAREEVKSIQTLLGRENAETYIGREATENVLMQKKSPFILHLATHGFFLSDQEMLSLETEFSDGSPEAIDISTKGQNKRVRINSPLLRSGIILAGANKTIKTGYGRSSEGILTAEKILSLDLTGTEMVVLSACETGIGESRKGEGVFGLRRAFTQAGAKSLVMSMWPVPDIETQELMVEFYKNIQSGKMNHCQALRQAALKQMQITKERYGFPNPLYWGAFIFLGEP